LEVKRGARAVCLVRGVEGCVEFAQERLSAIR
jgi:hypothetical protein